MDEGEDECWLSLGGLRKRRLHRSKLPKEETDRRARRIVT